MKNSDETNVEPLRMLPRFDSKAAFSETHLEQIPQSNSVYHYNPLSFEDLIFHENRLDQSFLLSQTVSYPQLAGPLLPRFHSDHRRNHYDENQSADTIAQTSNQTKTKISEFQEANYRPNKFDIKFLERAYDRSGKKCWPAINTNIGKFDLEYAYEIVGDTLESYIRYRKLNRCKALSNFIEYRNKVYKREKIAQYAQPGTKTPIKETRAKENIDSPIQMIKFKEQQSKVEQPSPPSAISKSIPINYAPSSPSVIPATSQKLLQPITKEEFIPIPSPDLLARPKSILSPKKTLLKANVNTKTKQGPVPSAKGQS